MMMKKSEMTSGEMLVDVARRIRDRQAVCDASDVEWCRRYRDLGSTKTYTRILAGKLEGYDVDRWLADYGRALNQVEADAQAEGERDPIYEDLSTVTRMRVAVLDAIGARNNDRLIVLQGPSGAGKTEALRCIAERFGKRVVLMEADETWKDSVNAFLVAILLRLGESVPASSAERMRSVIEALSASRVMLIIDEAHHLGPRQLNLVKSIINQTPGEVALAALDTLWLKLESTAYAESQQLIHNRLSERVQLSGPDVEDVRRILERRLGLETEEAQKAAVVVVRVARVKGSLKFVTRVCRRALATAGGERPGLEDVSRAVGTVSAMMGVRA